MTDEVSRHFAPEVVHPADDRFDAPPDPAEWQLTDIRMDARQPTAAGAVYECQSCGDGFRVGDEHVQALLREQVDSRPRYPSLKFCDEECWKAWASQG